MSVQAGIWNYDGRPANMEVLTRLSQTMCKYGPDGEMVYRDGSIALLYRPFHTTVESRAEQQPYVFAKGMVMTWDGRLDNREQLIAKLANDVPHGQTDLALVAAAFARWGTDCFATLIGDWALSVWSPCLQELILARDYIGIRHLFYYPTSKGVLWSSQLAPLALCGDRFTICEQYIAGRLASDPNASLTPYSEIYAVPPGGFVCVRNQTCRTLSHWTLNTQLRPNCRTDGEYEEEYRHLFGQAVRRRLRCDSPVLASLSGGLDSSSIVCMADALLAREPLQFPSVDTLSFYNSRESGSESDFHYFRAVENKRGKPGFHLDLASAQCLAFQNSGFVPNPNWGNRPDFAAGLASFLRDHRHRVLLSGEGGDEMNGQPLDPRVLMADLLTEFRIKDFARELIAWSLLIRKRPMIQLLLQTLLQFAPATVRARMTQQGKLDPWINKRFARKYRMSARQMETVEGLAIARPSIRDAAQTLATLSRWASCACPSSIEIRYPFLDRDLVEFLTTVPLMQLLRPGQRRSLMRRALADILPAEVCGRRTKASFDRCFVSALNEHWGEVHAVCQSPLSAELGYIEAQEFRDALLAMKNGKLPIYVTRLLNALCLEVWLRDVHARGLLSFRRALKMRPITTSSASEVYPCIRD